jgi:hypothetical protein
VGIIARTEHEAMLTEAYLPYGLSKVRITGIDDVERTVLSTLHVVKGSEGQGSDRQLLLLRQLLNSDVKVVLLRF